MAQQKKDSFVEDSFVEDPPDSFVEDSFVEDTPAPVAAPLETIAPAVSHFRNRDLENRPDAKMFSIDPSHKRFVDKQIADYVSGSPLVPEFARPFATRSAQALLSDLPSFLLDLAGDPENVAAPGLVRGPEKVAQGVKNIGQRMLTSGTRPVRETAPLLLPETTARNFVGAPAGSGGIVAESPWPSNMQDPVIGKELEAANVWNEGKVPIWQQYNQADEVGPAFPQRYQPLGFNAPGGANNQAAMDYEKLIRNGIDPEIAKGLSRADRAKIANQIFEEPQLASANRPIPDIGDTRLPQQPIIDITPVRSSNAPSQFSERYAQIADRPELRLPTGESLAEAPTLLERIKPVRGGVNFKPEEYAVIARKFEDPKAPGTFQKTWDLTKGLMGVDLPGFTSAAFRQGNMHFGTARWWKAWGKAFKAYGSKATADAMELATLNDPLFKPRFEPQFHIDGTPIIDAETGLQKLKELPSFAEQAGLRRGNLNNYITRDDMTRSGWAEQIPIYGRHVQGSNRGYNAFLNHIGDTMFKTLIEDAVKIGKDPMKDITVAKEIAKFVNVSLKRPDLAKFGDADLEKSVDLINNLIWSPRNIAAELKMFNPKTYLTGSPEIKKQYMLANGRRLGMWLGMAGMAQQAGAKVNFDPTSSDFGKIQIGNTRFDPPGGMQQFIVLMTRIMMQRRTSSTTDQTTEYMSRQGFNATDEVTRFAGNRLHPSLDLIGDLGKGGSRQDPVGVLDRVLQSVIPLPITGAVEAINEDPMLIPVMMFLNSTGMGTQTYKRGDKFNAPKIWPNKWDVLLPSH